MKRYDKIWIESLERYEDDTFWDSAIGGPVKTVKDVIVLSLEELSLLWTTATAQGAKRALGQPNSEILDFKTYCKQQDLKL